MFTPIWFLIALSVSKRIGEVTIEIHLSFANMAIARRVKTIL